MCKSCRDKYQILIDQHALNKDRPQDLAFWLTDPTEVMIIEFGGEERQVMQDVLRNHAQYLRYFVPGEANASVEIRMKLQMRDGNDAIEAYAIKQMLDYCWSMQYSSKGAETDPLTVHVHMYVLGCKYQVEGLSELALDRLDYDVNTRFEDQDLTSQDYTFHSALISAVIEAFDDTLGADITLRKKIHSLLVGVKAVAIFVDGEFELRAANEDFEAFDEMLTKKFSPRHESRSTQAFRCPFCNRNFKAKISTGAHFHRQLCNFCNRITVLSGSEWEEYVVPAVEW